jgi:hypothetical protein
LRPLPPKEFSLLAVAKALCPGHCPSSSSSASACRCALDREERRGHDGGVFCRRAQGSNPVSLFLFPSFDFGDFLLGISSLGVSQR